MPGVLRTWWATFQQGSCQEAFWEQIPAELWQRWQHLPVQCLYRHFLLWSGRFPLIISWPSHDLKKKNKNTWLLSLNTFLAWALISKHVTAALACPRFAGLLTHFTALWFASLLDNLQVPAVRRFMEESGSGPEMRPGQAAERGWTWGGLKSGAMWGWHLNLSPTLFVTSGRACAQLYG